VQNQRLAIKSDSGIQDLSQGGKAMKKAFDSTFGYKVIYVFQINAESHKGLLKIGDTTLNTDSPIDSLAPNSKELNQAAFNRIKQYTNTAGLSPKLLHTELAIRTVKNKDGKPELKPFRDHDVHRVLINSGIKKKNIANSTSKEWFKVDLDTVKKAIDAVKKGKSNFTHSGGAAFVPIVFRPEQEDAIAKALKQFKTGNRMLWNAKMRFGKTLCALEVVKEAKYEKTIILTHRPVVDMGWFEDFGKIFYDDNDYAYGSKNTGTEIDKLIASGKKFVYFASIQDLRGSATVGGKFEKNDVVFSTDWDLVIVDEAHEGTTTALGDEVIKKIVKENSGHDTKFLALSGTPFNILKDYDDNIYTWDYVMEQRCKQEWAVKHFGDSNPYDELPELRIYTYDLGQIVKQDKYVELEDKAFNFHEFFRTVTGDLHYDGCSVPAEKNIGDFLHENDVSSFLDLITKTDENSNYPYSSEKYRNLFRHALWMVPGVREAKALSKLLKNHPVFGSGVFDIVNVAGDGDEEEKSEDALKKVQDAIAAAGEDGYTITLSCGKLTTGVTVPEWTAVFMLAGSSSTSASSYLQTIFRVQSPCKKNGKIKESCYVFDFAPDRTLKMVAEAAAISTKAGKTPPPDKVIMGEFLNYCPVIAVSGTMMKQYDTNRLLQQLKRAYAERAVKNGFDDVHLYNDELLKLDKLDLKQFDKLKKIVGTSKAAPKTDEIDINNQGFTDEQYEEIERIEKKKKAELTPEEAARLKELQEKKKQKATAISILRGISIRIPLLIYGADVNVTDDITIEKLPSLVDDTSWNEFMPNGVTKDLFKRFIKYYDPEIFIAAGRRIRAEAFSADSLVPLERVKKITALFSCFKNPDKETVLTPWRVVNMHMSDCIGGYDFYNEAHTELLDEPRFVDRGKVTADTFSNEKAQVLEINSKSGLYPLYVTYSIYRSKCGDHPAEHLDNESMQKIWDETVAKNVFVVCKTPMAKSITQRTLVGYRKVVVNTHYFDDLINMLRNKPENFTKKILKCSYWNMDGGGKMEFDAVVGNPPYQVMDGGSKASATPVYNYFVEKAIELKPKYLSMIIPARWYSGGRNLDSFRDEMLHDRRICKLFDFTDSNDCFAGVDIAGGVCYFLWNAQHDGECEVVNLNHGESFTSTRKLDDGNVFVRHSQALSIIEKTKQSGSEYYDVHVSSQKPFGLRTYVVPTKTGDIQLRYNKGIGPFKRDKVTAGVEWIDKWKVIMSYLTYDHAGRTDKEGKRRIFSTMEILPPKTVCTETYIVIDCFDTKKEAQNLLAYLKTRFVRFLVAQVTTTQHISKSNFTLVPVQDFSKPWTDAELYAKYNLSDDEIAFIESLIKPME
jgi:hypothetical protein